MQIHHFPTPPNGRIGWQNIKLMQLIRIEGNDTPSMTVIARKVALAFRLAALGEKAGLIEDAGDGN